MPCLQSADVARVVTWPGTVAVQASEARPQRKRRMEGGAGAESEEAGADGSSLPCTRPATYPRSSPPHAQPGRAARRAHGPLNEPAKGRGRSSRWCPIRPRPR